MHSVKASFIFKKEKNMNKELNKLVQKYKCEIAVSKTGNEEVKFYFYNYQSDFYQFLKIELSDGIPLDNFRLRTVYYFLEALEEDSNVENAIDYLEPDISTFELLAWIESNLGRTGYVNDLLLDGSINDFNILLSLAQKQEIEEVCYVVYRYLKHQLDNSVEKEI
jgi:hypothetical protein